MKTETDILVQIAIEENKLSILEQIYSSEKRERDIGAMLSTSKDIDVIKGKIETLNWVLEIYK